MTRPKYSTDRPEMETTGGTLESATLSSAATHLEPQNIFDRELFEEFRDTIGNAKMRLALEDLSTTLRERFGENPSAQPDRERTFNTAHMLAGRAGMMGFTALRDACVQLQQACATQAPFSEEYGAACRISLPSQYVIASLLKRLS